MKFARLWNFLFCLTNQKIICVFEKIRLLNTSYEMMNPDENKSLTTMESNISELLKSQIYPTGLLCRTFYKITPLEILNNRTLNAFY